MNRQYIGARYVPKFFENPNGGCDWIKALSYEPLTVVTYLGNSYTSRKFVPLNTEITNSEFWCPTGNYNAQIEEYRKETSDYSSKVELYSKKVDDWLYFTGKNILIIGDSISDESVNPPNWVARAKEHLSGVASITNVSVAGAHYNEIPSMISKFETLNEFDLIIVEMGVNDFKRNDKMSVFNTNVRSALQSIRDKNGKANVFIITPISCTSTESNTLGYNLQMYRACLVGVCKDLNYPFMNGTDLPYLTSGAGYDYLPDGTHPSKEYADFMCRMILNKIATGGDSSFASDNLNIANVSQYLTNCTGDLFCYIDSALKMHILGNITTSVGLTKVTMGDITKVCEDLFTKGKISADQYKTVASSVANSASEMITSIVTPDGNKLRVFSSATINTGSVLSFEFTNSPDWLTGVKQK